MYLYIQNALTLVAGIAVFLFYGYGIAAIGYPLFFGGWPISVYYSILFFVVLVCHVKTGANLLFFIAVIVSVAFTFALLLLGQVTTETAREPLFSRGIPTVFGGVWTIALCVAIVMFACGLCKVLRDLRAFQIYKMQVREKS